MIPGFEKLVEERIKKARKEGAFENLDHSGKPLSFDDLNIPEEFRMAHKVLKNAGFLPPEVELRKKISRTGELLEAAATGSPEHQKLSKKLNYLLTKLDTVRGHSASPLLTGVYGKNLTDKIS